MPFSLTNALATFQLFIDDCLRAYFDHFTVYHFDDILIYSENKPEYDGHVRQLLQQLREI
jgi:hypothetical protein